MPAERPTFASKARDAAEAAAVQARRQLRLTSWSILIAGFAAGLSAISAAFTGYQAYVARQQMVLEMRPYVVVDFPDRPLSEKGVEGVQLRAHVRNYGRTPAYDMKKKAYLQALEYGALEDVETPIDTRPEIVHPGTNSRNTIRVDKYMKDNEERLRSGKYSLILLVPMEYKDVFGNLYRERPCFYLYVDFEKYEVVGARQCAEETGIVSSSQTDWSGAGR